jgi:hypothetical protein
MGRLGALGACLAALLAWAAAAPAQITISTGGGGGCVSGGCAGGSCGAPGCTTGCTTCQRLGCPPPYRHCTEGPPCIRFLCGCPRPVCNPCEQQNWGYFQPCWRPWPWPHNWNHCAVPGPAAFIPPGPPPEDKDSSNPTEGPTPRKMDSVVPSAH